MGVPVTVTGSSTMDPMSHTLLTALTATPPVKDWSRRSQELELATRKMAATHPLLFLRCVALAYCLPQTHTQYRM